jgi:hypothetical protein
VLQRGRRGEAADDDGGAGGSYSRRRLAGDDHAGATRARLPTTTTAELPTDPALDNLTTSRRLITINMCIYSIWILLVFLY